MFRQDARYRLEQNTVFALHAFRNRSASSYHWRGIQRLDEGFYDQCVSKQVTSISGKHFTLPKTPYTLLYISFRTFYVTLHFTLHVCHKENWQTFHQYKGKTASLMNCKYFYRFIQAELVIKCLLMRCLAVFCSLVLLAVSWHYEWQKTRFFKMAGLGRIAEQHT